MITLRGDTIQSKVLLHTSDIIKFVTIKTKFDALFDNRTFVPDRDICKMNKL